MISTHAPAQGATYEFYEKHDKQAFQPTLPHRERPNIYQDLTANMDLSTHAPAQGATSRTIWFDKHCPLSTHAPAQGATRRYQVMVAAHGKLSTHAPAQGATCVGKCNQRAAGSFQPTLPHRERPNLGFMRVSGFTLSTHAPAQGATVLPKPMYLIRTLSTHAPAQGATSARPAGPGGK